MNMSDKKFKMVTTYDRPMATREDVDPACGNISTWYFSTDGTGAYRVYPVASRSESKHMNHRLLLNITLDSSDAGAKISNIDYVNGSVTFDRPVGKTIIPVAQFHSNAGELVEDEDEARRLIDH